MPTPQPGVPPVVFDMPTLGRAVCLGELYDHRSGKFLGAHLYPQDKIKEVVTDIRHTELSVSLSTTHEQKARLLDINARLSLEALGGLFKVSGSASYLNDEKSNSQEYAYALALKMRLNETRILFTENELGRNVLPVAEKDYINTGLATHFVSAIVYGGSFIVNLVARQSEMSKEEKIEGKLQVQFDKLKGAISLEGEADVTIKGTFDDMNDKFDLVVHGDVALEKVPINPKDVLDTFPKAASLISGHGGVPISVTLQPIPVDLYKGALIYQLDEDIVDVVLMEFSKLDDFRSRFLVLEDDTKRLQDFVPELARMTRIVAAAYARDYSKLLHKLGTFLQDYKLGNKPDHDDVLKTATQLYETHLDSNKKESTQYPSSLVGLEQELLRFQNFITDIRRVRESLRSSTKSTGAVQRSFYLSSIEDVCSAIRIQSKTPLFIMVPISGNNSNHNLTILKYLAIVRKYAAYFEASTNTGHMFYAENLKHLEDTFPNYERFSSLTIPSLFIGEVDGEGELTWASPPNDPDHTFALDHKPTDDYGIGRLALNSARPLDGTKAFSIQFCAKQGSDKNASSTILCAECAADKSVFFRFWKDASSSKLQFTIHASTEVVLGKNASQSPDKDNMFMGTFVQDTQNKQWILYINERMIEYKVFTDRDLILKANKLQIVFLDPTRWWDGQLFDVKTFSRALSQGEVRDAYIAWKK